MSVALVRRRSRVQFPPEAPNYKFELAFNPTPDAPTKYLSAKCPLGLATITIKFGSPQQCFQLESSFAARRTTVPIVGASNVGRDLEYYVHTLGATKAWDRSRFGTREAAVRLSDGPLVLLAENRPRTVLSANI